MFNEKQRRAILVDLFRKKIKLSCAAYNILATHDNWIVRNDVLGDESVPEKCRCEILKILSDDEHWINRHGAATRAVDVGKCACDSLRKLIEDSIRIVRDDARNVFTMLGCGG